MQRTLNFKADGKHQNYDAIMKQLLWVINALMIHVQSFEVCSVNVRNRFKTELFKT